MNVESTGARPLGVALSKTLASADVARSRQFFARTLERHDLARGGAEVRARLGRAAAPTPSQETPSSAPVALEAEPAPAARRPEPPTHAPGATDQAAPAEPHRALAGDINGDGAVNVFDFATLAAAFGTDNAEADLDASGTVDQIDLAIFRHNFGKTAESSETPAGATAEPADRGATTGDLNHDGRIDVLDFGRFAASYAAKDGAADLYPDGEINEIDVAVFKQLFRDAT